MCSKKDFKNLMNVTSFLRNKRDVPTKETMVRYGDGPIWRWSDMTTVRYDEVPIWRWSNMTMVRYDDGTIWRWFWRTHLVVFFLAAEPFLLIWRGHVQDDRSDLARLPSKTSHVLAMKKVQYDDCPIFTAWSDMSLLSYKIIPIWRYSNFDEVPTWQSFGSDINDQVNRLLTAGAIWRWSGIFYDGPICTRVRIFRRMVRDDEVRYQQMDQYKVAYGLSKKLEGIWRTHLVVFFFALLQEFLQHTSLVDRTSKVILDNTFAYTLVISIAEQMTVQGKLSIINLHANVIT